MRQRMGRSERRCRAGGGATPSQRRFPTHPPVGEALTRHSGGGRRAAASWFPCSNHPPRAPASRASPSPLPRFGCTPPEDSPPTPANPRLAPPPAWRVPRDQPPSPEICMGLSSEQLSVTPGRPDYESQPAALPPLLRPEEAARRGAAPAGIRSPTTTSPAPP
ncbi:uncharacterized protein LOC144457019 [Phascolarctos cinereus]